MKDPAISSMSWARTLIGFDTTSRNSNLALIETVRDSLARRGFIVSLTYDANNGKANLLATLPDRDGGTRGGLVFSGHTDVVPVDGQNWRTDPFAATVNENRLYGRGAADMKCFIAAALALAETLRSQILHQPLHLALSYDEEAGCLGAPALVEDIVRRDLRPSGCIVGEPTMMRVVTAHKGINAYRCTVHGHAAHSSLQNQGVNAIEHAALMIAHVRTIAARHAANGPFDEGFELPFTTAQTGTIQGGLALNVIPDFCRFEFEFRNVPKVEAQGVLAEIDSYADVQTAAMQARYAATGVVIERLASAPPLEAFEEAAVTRLARVITGDTAISKVSYGTEAGLFQRAGIPTIVCGPGSITEAHRPNEFIALDQIRACETFLAAATETLKRPSLPRLN